MKKSNPSNHVRSKWVNLALALFSVIFVVLVIEGGTRLFIYYKFGDPNFGQIKLSYFPFLVFVEALGRIKPENKAEFHTPQMNLLEILKEPPPPIKKKYRILVLGGSTARDYPMIS